MKGKWRHDALQADLAAHLAATRGRMIWEDMQLGPAHSARPDVFTMRKSFTDPRPLVYEVKISVSDFRADITEGKWQRYLEFSTGVIFAAPAGLISKADLPRGCGLMTRGENGWHTLRAPTRQTCTLPQKVLLKLLIDGIDRERAVQAHKRTERVSMAAAQREALADEVREAILDAETVRGRVASELDYARRKAERITKEAERDAEAHALAASRDLRDLRAACGLGEEATVQEIRLAAAAMLRSLDSDPIVGALRNKARWAAKQAQELWDEIEALGKPPA